LRLLRTFTNYRPEPILDFGGRASAETTQITAPHFGACLTTSGTSSLAPATWAGAGETIVGMQSPERAMSVQHAAMDTSLAISQMLVRSPGPRTPDTLLFLSSKASRAWRADSASVNWQFRLPPPPCPLLSCRPLPTAHEQYLYGAPVAVPAPSADVNIAAPSNSAPSIWSIRKLEGERGTNFVSNPIKTLYQAIRPDMYRVERMSLMANLPLHG